MDVADTDCLVRRSETMSETASGSARPLPSSLVTEQKYVSRAVYWPVLHVCDVVVMLESILTQVGCMATSWPEEDMCCSLAANSHSSSSSSRDQCHTYDSLMINHTSC